VFAGNSFLTTPDVALTKTRRIQQDE